MPPIDDKKAGDAEHSEIILRDAIPADQAWMVEFLKGFGAPMVISGAKIHDVRELPCIIAERAGQRVGALVYRIDEDAVEGVVVRSLERQKGIGRILMNALIETTKKLGKRRIYFTTTNDNLPAQALHASMGFQVSHRDVGGFAKVIKLMGHDPDKVEMIGQNGEPITDILHYERIFRDE